tara:strand:+ start:2252 stop:2635 length:384 start_codon:yes stop_codon:yes gene_type:complete
MDNFDTGNVNHYQLAAAQQKQRDLKQKKYEEKSKKRLSNIVSTKIKTSFIGAISSCEESFGFLWGHGKDEADLTEEESTMREMWEILRAKILDNGNTQLRAAINEINSYSISWDRYKMEIPVKEEEE